MEEVETGILMFAKTLRQNLEGFDGENSEVVGYAPEFFDFYVQLLDDERFPQMGRLLVNAAIAYFVSPTDVIPEEEVGPAGYIDDVYLCAYVANRLRSTIDDEILAAAWPSDEDFHEVVDFLIDQTREKLDRSTRDEVTRYVGVQ